ncbi:hypothetical protein GQ568_01405 [Patescibacteria group bacterium]|nr:hypothetical protein [Patescibacteria group bacterium]
MPIYILAILSLLLLLLLISKCSDVCPINYCSSGYSFSSSLSMFTADISRVFFAMLFWFISPIGVLFLLGIKLFFSEKASMIRRNFALLLQFLSFLSWSSLMFILLVVYIDSVSYKVFDLGGDILNLAIKSGFGFMIFMLILAVAEKKIIFKQKHSLEKRNNESDGKEKNNSNSKKRKKKEESVKIAGIEVGGIKQKVRRKLKENLKEIVDKEIDKRL